ncbi:hypothetical protein HY492_02790 [Candidatus Woesearchaeota archaeon]|nr:hypothetical protein [Candidatus Woesearchaeota archaeon]
MKHKAFQNDFWALRQWLPKLTSLTVQNRVKWSEEDARKLIDKVYCSIAEQRNASNGGVSMSEYLNHVLWLYPGKPMNQGLIAGHELSSLLRDTQAHKPAIASKGTWTYHISLLFVDPRHPEAADVMLEEIEQFARDNQYARLSVEVAMQNEQGTDFFAKREFILHKADERTMLFSKRLACPSYLPSRDYRSNHLPQFSDRPTKHTPPTNTLPSLPVVIDEYFRD